MITANRIRAKLLSLKGNTATSLTLAGTTTTIAFFSLNIIFARFFTKGDFGTWKQIMLAIQFVIPLFTLGIPEGYKYLIASDKENTQKLLASGLGLTSVIFTLLLGLSHLGLLDWIGPLLNNTALNSIDSTLPFFFLIIVLGTMVRYQAINEENNRAILGSSFLAATGLLLAGVATVFFYVTNEIHTLLIRNLLLTLGCFHIIGFAFLYTKLSGFKLPKLNFDRNNLTEILKFGVPLYLASYVGILTINMDKLIVTNQGGAELFAIYSIGAVQIPFIGIISSSVSNSLFPKLVNTINVNIVETKRMWLDATVNTSYIIYPLVICLLIISKPLVILAFGDQYSEAVPIFRAYLLTMIWRNNSYGALIMAKGNTKYITLYSALTLVLNAIFSYFLYTQLGIIGVVYGTFLAISFIALIQLAHENMFKLFIRKFYGNPIIAAMLLLITCIYVYLL